jgi:polar amino acid transport system substrate-binding protein
VTRVMSSRRNYNRRLFLHYLGYTTGTLLLGGTSATLFTACDAPFPNSSRTATPQATKIEQKGLLMPGTLQWGATALHNAPFLYHLPSSNGLIGFEYDIVNAITRLIGITQKLIETDYSQLDQSLQSGQYDIILNNWTGDPQKSKAERFSQAYYRAGQQIVVRTDDPRFKDKSSSDSLSLLDLEDLTVGTLPGHTADLLAADNAIRVRVYNDVLPFIDLLMGRIDAIFASSPTVSFYVLGHGTNAQAKPSLKLIGQPFEFCDYVIAFNGNSTNAPTLQKEIDQAITVLKSNGVLATICKKWGLWNDMQPQIDTQL